MRWSSPHIVEPLYRWLIEGILYTLATIFKNFSHSPLERYSNVRFAVVLLTPDDVGYPRKRKPKKLWYRARQNVIFELGFFIGRLTRERVCVLRKGEVEQLSDYHGVVYVPMDPGGGWKGRLVSELEEAGLSIDPEKLKDALKK